MATNRALGEETRTSAKKMEELTIKTNRETISMRIITLVTLFYLPGTFISVSSIHHENGFPLIKVTRR